MTQIRIPANVAKKNASNVWSGTQDFSGATVLGVTGGGGAGGTVAGATSTAAGVVQLAGDLAGTYTAPTVPALAGKVDKTALAAVATSGAYTDLTGKPALAPVATSGNYTDLTGRPALAPVASSGNYTDLTSRPALAAVATSGAYGDLTGAPTVPTVYLRAKTANTTTTATTQSTDPELTIASVPVGTYELRAVLAPASTAVATTNIFVKGTASTLTGSGNMLATNSGFAPAAFAMGSSFGLSSSLGSALGSLVVTAAGSLTVGLASGTNGSVAGLGLGTVLILTKVA